MLILAKPDKLQKFEGSPFFSVCSVSHEATDYQDMEILAPSAEILDARKSGNLKKKKFFEKYEKYLKRVDTLVEWTIFSIGVSVANGVSIVLTCSKNEWDTGYLEFLGDFLSEKLGVELVKASDADDYLKNAFQENGIGKKKRVGFDSLPEAKKEKVFSTVTKTVADTFFRSSEYFDELLKKFKVETVVYNFEESKVVTFDKKNNIKSIDATAFNGKKKELVEALLAPSEFSKKETRVPSVIRDVLKGHDIAYKEKALKKLDKDSLINLICECYTALGKLRAGELGEE